jgi:hypothetical protein
MRSRRASLVAFAAATLGLTFAACTDLSGLSGATDAADASAIEAGVDAPDALATPDAAVVDDDMDAFVPEDAATRTDANVRVDAAGCASCDCDMDTFSRADVVCGGSVGGDCDDTDPLIKPGQSFVDEPWSSTHLPKGDWNCDGNVEKQSPELFKCTGIAPECSLTEGFLGTPACGELADYFRCQKAGVNCVAVKLTTKRQACR